MIRTLCDLLPLFARLGHREAVRYSNGFRSWRVSYADLLRRSGSCAHYFESQRIVKGDRIILWGENRPEWAAAFWAAVARGIHVVPLDVSSTPDFIRKVVKETTPRLLVHGNEVDPSDIEVPELGFAELQESGDKQLEAITTEPEDIVEIVYTSGTTTLPKGVVLRHGNICANLRPFAEEFHRYRLLAVPFQPIRLLNLLPLSHMFGQSMGLFIPPLLGGSSVFLSRTSPASITETIRREKVSVLVAVPRILDQLSRYVSQASATTEKRIITSGIVGVVERWLKYRKFHSAMGLKFWAIVVGGATLSEELERFWASLGILVIQGYGLTEASPIVALNHPFHTNRGSIGKPIKGQEVRISSEGEILVRGPSVVTQYWGKSPHEIGVSEDGWLRTGDLGEYDEAGNLRFKGRKGEVIVTSEGLNVYPQDIEHVLDRCPEVAASVVVGRTKMKGGAEQIHAVLLLETTSVNLDHLIRQVNGKLEPYQRIKSWEIWPDPDFPRTPSTLKINRNKVIAAIQSDSESHSQKSSLARSWLDDLLPSIQSPLDATQDFHLEKDLGLSSLDRIELLSKLQLQSPVHLDETTFSHFSTTGEVSKWFQDKRSPVSEVSELRPSTTPRWTRWFPVQAFRNATQSVLVVPLFRHYIEFSVTGLEHFDDVVPPVIFAANHCSNLDTIAVLSALPFQWRSRVAPAIRQEYFAARFQRADFKWGQRVRSSFEYFLACTLFNTFPLPQKMGGIQKTLRYTGELVEKGYCPLLFPEGVRSEDGTIQPFMPGIGVMATKLEIPVVPVYIHGLHEILPPNSKWPKSGRCTLRFGPHLRSCAGKDPRKVTRQVEAAVRKLEICSSGTSGDKVARVPRS